VSKHDAQRFVADRRQELKTLAMILNQANLIRDPRPFYDAECALTGEVEAGIHLWSCTLESVEFVEVDVKKTKMKHTRPKHIRSVDVELSVTFEGRCLNDADLRDPFRKLSIQAVVSGYGDGDNPWLCAWHVDRHIQGEDEDEGDEKEEFEEDTGMKPGTPHFVHPYYHFQYGGEGVWGLTDEECGLHLLLEAPRLAHPPMDAVLAIDFVLSNYYGRRWQELRQESAYRRVVRTAHDRIWRPYAFATASKWSNESESPWSSELLWPHLLPSDSDLLRESAAMPAESTNRSRRR
jgi:hypothetical protein